MIGGAGERRTLRIVAEHANHWNLPFASPEQFRAKREVLAGHCDAVGRDLSEIECSVQIALPADEDPAESAAKAAALGEAGVDTVLFTMRVPYRAAMIEPLAVALADAI